MDHRSISDMIQPALFKTIRPELHDLAQKVIMSQAEEITQYQTWLAPMETTRAIQQSFSHTNASPFVPNTGTR
jgi:uncharacterized protein (DUF305 family)